MRSFRNELVLVAGMAVGASALDASDEAQPLTACPGDNMIVDPPQFQWTYHPATAGNRQPYYSGVLEYGEATFTIGGQTLTTRAYRQAGGTFTIPGPTLRMVPGNTYVLRYHNLLPYQPASVEHPAVDCVTVPVADGQPCGDADVCDGAESCLAGVCTAGAPLDCSDGDGCTVDSCDPTAGCSHLRTCGSPATGSYDQVSGTIRVSMNWLAATLSISAGNILLGTTVCGTLTGTDTVVVNGTGALTIRGDFVPGRTVEPVGSREIEFAVNNDIITFDGGPGNDSMVIVPAGADLNADGDQDVTMSGSQTSITYRGGRATTP